MFKTHHVPNRKNGAALWGDEGIVELGGGCEENAVASLRGEEEGPYLRYPDG